MMKWHDAVGPLMTPARKSGGIPNPNGRTKLSEVVGNEPRPKEFPTCQGVIKMSTVFGLLVAGALLIGGVWANVTDAGPLSQARGAWVSHVR
jgi:hypothetical protein